MRIKKLSITAPGEIVPVMIDFKNLVSSIDSVVVSATVREGVDAAPGDIIFSSSQIAGTQVRQLIEAGLDDTVYLIRMDIASGDLRFSGAVYLPVQELV